MGQRESLGGPGLASNESLGDSGLSPVQGQGTGASRDPGTASTATGGTTVPGGTVPTAGSVTPPTVAALPPPGGTTRPVADRSPVKVGILVTLNDAQGSAGVDDGSTFTVKKTFQGLVTDWNRRGGLGGRRIVPTYFELRSTSSNFAADLQAACTQFTQDERVDAVLSITGAYSEAFAKCMGTTPVLAGDYALGDAVALGGTPHYFAPDALTTDRRVLAVLRRYVSRSDVVGVIVEDCPYNQRTYEQTFLPEADRLGLNVKDHVRTRCMQSLSDLQSQASDMQGAVLRFRQRGVTKVLFVSGSNEGNLVLLFMTAAEGQSFTPRYAFSSAAGPALQEANTPKRQLANSAVLGWLPALDSSQFTSTTVMEQCAAAVQRGAGVSPRSPLDRYQAGAACDLFTLYDAALRATQGQSDPSLIKDALHRVSLVSAASLEGAVDLSRRQDGPQRARTVAWVTGCSCFRYTGTSFGI